MKPIRWAMRPLQTVAPVFAARVAERLFFTPPHPRASAGLRAFLASGRRFVLRVQGRRVVGWRWGQGPTVYLVHGWGSRGGRLQAFAEPLLQAGYSIVTFDAPGHGVSGRGMSSMPEFARALMAIVEREGSAHAVIAHSLGAAATTFALARGLSAGRVVFLAPPANPASWVTAFARALGLEPRTVERMQRRSEQRLEFQWADLDIPRLARTLDVPLFIAHDADDKVVPWQDGAAIAAAWPDARLITTHGLGHSGVARAADVVREAVAFVCSAQAAPSWQDESAQLEYELFCPEARWAAAV